MGHTHKEGKVLSPSENQKFSLAESGQPPQSLPRKPQWTPPVGDGIFLLEDGILSSLSKNGLVLVLSSALSKPLSKLVLDGLN